MSYPSKLISNALNDERRHWLEIKQQLIFNIEEMEKEQIKWDLQKTMTQDKIK